MDKYNTVQYNNVNCMLLSTGTSLAPTADDLFILNDFLFNAMSRLPESKTNLEFSPTTFGFKRHRKTLLFKLRYT